MEKTAIWCDPLDTYTFPKIQEDIKCDVAIIGAGICGITAAQLLSKKGLSVVVLETGKVAESNTGRSTGNLYSTIEPIFSELHRKQEIEILKQVESSRHGAVDFIEENIKAYNIKCDFRRVPWCLFSAVESKNSKIKKEYDTQREMGMMTEWMEEPVLFPFKGKVGIKLNDQAQFNPYQYVRQLARAIETPECQIFENSHVNEIDSQHNGHTIKVGEFEIKSQYLIEATHTPVGFSTLQTVLGPYREYGVASKIPSLPFPEGIYWGYYEGDEKISIRTFSRPDGEFIMAIGSPHKVGQGEGEEHIQVLKDYLRKYFQVESFDYIWGGQHYRPADGLPYIGKKLGVNTFVATGFSTDGLTFGTLAAHMITQDITKEASPYKDLYRATRLTPVKSAFKFVKENTNVAAQYLKDYLKTSDHTHLYEGDGKVVTHEGKKIAVCKLGNGEVEAHSAVCPHMGCIVHWNKLEGSWDCPCHGSRFNAKGKVLEGPSLDDLKTYAPIDQDFLVSRSSPVQLRPEIQT